MLRYKVTMLNGQTASLNIANGADTVLVTGTPTLTQNWSLVPSGTAAIGQVLLIQYRAVPTLTNSAHVILFDTTLPDNLVGYKLDVTATYTASGWQTTIIPSFDQNGFIETVKLVNIGRNYLLIGGTDDAVRAIDISHIIEVNDDNTLSLKAGIISPTELKSDFELPLGKIVSITKDKFIKANASTGVLEAADIIVELPAALTNLTPGTATAGKAVILDGNGQVSDLDLINIKISGVLLNTTITTLNLLASITSDHIDLLKYMITAGLTTADIDRVISERP